MRLRVNTVTIHTYFKQPVHRLLSIHKCFKQPVHGLVSIHFINNLFTGYFFSGNYPPDVRYNHWTGHNHRIGGRIIKMHKNTWTKRIEISRFWNITTLLIEVAAGTRKSISLIISDYSEFQLPQRPHQDVGYYEISNNLQKDFQRLSPVVASWHRMIAPHPSTE